MNNIDIEQKTQLLNKLKEYCLKPDYVRNKAPKQDTFQFEWEKKMKIFDKNIYNYFKINKE